MFHCEKALPYGKYDYPLGIEENKEFYKNNDTEYLDFFKYIERQGSNHQIYYKSDLHWNPNGHREVANFLERKLTKQKIAYRRI